MIIHTDLMNELPKKVFILVNMLSGSGDYSGSEAYGTMALYEAQKIEESLGARDLVNTAVYSLDFCGYWTHTQGRSV